MKFIFFALLLSSCCPCKEVPVDYFQQDKNRYRDLLGKGKITDCEYYELMIGAYEIEEMRKLTKKK